MSAPIEKLIAELRRLHEAATCEGWFYDSYNSLFDRSGVAILAQVPDHPEDGEWRPDQQLSKEAWHRESSNNAALIVAARNALPLLLDRIAYLERQISLDENSRDPEFGGCG